MFNKSKSNINVVIQGVNGSNVKIQMIKNKNDVTISVATNSKTKVKDVDQKSDQITINCSTGRKDTVDVSVDANKERASKHDESSDESNDDNDSDHHYGTETDTTTI